jgi:arginine-tRNA-protein transferase
LVGVATTDELPTGLSLVYTFYDPVLANQRGLGTFAILTQIAYAQQLGLPYVYPGYWIEQSQKMSYKIRFQPIEGYINGQWSRIK